jgi:hypothetical protein
MRKTLMAAVGVLTLSVAAPARAQSVESIARLAVDTEVSVRTSVAKDGTPQTTVMIDGVQNVRLVGGWTLVSRPMAVRRTGAPWALHLAQFAARRESTAGPVAMRLEVGLRASPVGLGSLTARAAANPTIAPAAPFGRGVTVETGAPGVQLYPLTYPFGAVASFSTHRWDARAGVIDTTPLRVRWPLEDDRPPAAAHLLLGGGVTPRQGLRLGGWFMRGDWARRSEITSRVAPGNRSASSGGVEVEYEVAWTRVAGEWTGSRVSTATGSAAPASWMIEGLQTVSPRWFVAGRLRRADAFGVPPRGFTGSTTAAGLRSVDEHSREVVIGYRATPSFTVRGGYLVTRAYGAASWSHRAETSLVWAQRWR